MKTPDITYKDHDLFTAFYAETKEGERQRGNIMSFQERLAKQLEQAPSRTVYNAHQKPAYDWSREANQKRSIR